MTTVLDQYRPQIVELCRKYAVKRLDAFGSVVRPDFDPNSSDADFFYELEREPLDSYADRFFGFLTEPRGASTAGNDGDSRSKPRTADNRLAASFPHPAP